MIRRLMFAAAAAVIGTMMVAGPASALTRKTLTCIKDQRSEMRDCLNGCREDLNTSLPICFGPQEGVDCAKRCQTAQSACQAGPAGRQATCLAGCRTALTDALEPCRAIADKVARAACESAARNASLSCRLGCRDGEDENLAACSTVFNNCLQACASDPSGE